MGIMAIVGLQGVGKTLSMSYMGIRNYLKGEKVYANYWLAFNYEFVSSVEEIDAINNPKILKGKPKTPSVFLGDELWSWMDSRESPKARNKFLTGLLLRSRRRRLQIFYTAQDIMQIDARLRRVTNYVAFPRLSPEDPPMDCELRIHELINYGLGKARVGRHIKTIPFKTALIFEIYDTEDESWEL